MNFSIFNSDGAKIFWGLALTILLLFAGSGVLLRFYVASQTTKTKYVQEIRSKAQHMHLNLADQRPDIIFVGNSRTEYHISQAIFEQAGFKIYNYGVSGAYLSNYPFMASKAAALKPRIIAISLPIDDLYTHTLKLKPSLDAESLQAILTTDFSAGIKLEAFKNYLIGLNTIRLFADPIYARIKNFYHRYAPFKSAASSLLVKSRERIFKDCKVYKVYHLPLGRIAHKCTNGDMIMDAFGYHAPQRKHVFLGAPATQKIHFLNRIIQSIQSHGILPVIILEPHADKSYVYDKQALMADIKTITIDLTNMSTPVKWWADSGHFNGVGRHHYSIQLADLLRTAAIKYRKTAP